MIGDLPCYTYGDTGAKQGRSKPGVLPGLVKEGSELWLVCPQGASFAIGRTRVRYSDIEPLVVATHGRHLK